MPDHSKIIILDIDGPMLPERMYACPKNRLTTQHPMHFDPAAVAMVNTLMRLGPCSLVISSNWEDRCLVPLANNGMDMSTLHSDAFVPSHQNHTLTRKEQVLGWLFKHPEISHWVAFDDLPVPEPGGIQVTYADGIQLEHYLKAFEVLDIPLP